jgi:hypothetical protein
MESDGQNTSTSLWSDFPVMCMKLHQGKVVFSSSLMFCPKACTLVAVFAGSFYCECITDLQTLKPYNAGQRSIFQEAM